MTDNTQMDILQASLKRWKELVEENGKLKQEIHEQNNIIDKLDEKVARLRAIEKDITLHDDYERLLKISSVQQGKI